MEGASNEQDPADSEGGDVAEPADSDGLDEAWAAVLAAWDDDGAHKRFVTLCAATDRLAVAGRRYREVKDSSPERAPRAEKQIDAVLGVAMQSLEAERTEPPPQRARTLVFMIAFAVSFGLIASALWAMSRSF